MEPEHDLVLLGETLTETPKRAAQKGMQPDLLQKNARPGAGGMENIFRRGLTSKQLVVVASMPPRYTFSAHVTKTKPRVYAPEKN